MTELWSTTTPTSAFEVATLRETRAPMTTSRPTQLGMVGLGRMGANLVQRVVRDGHHAVVFDVNRGSVTALEASDIVGATSLEDFVARLSTPRAIWLMLPAAITQHVLDELVPLLEKDDVVIDGGTPTTATTSCARRPCARTASTTSTAALAGACGDSNAATA